MNKYIINFALAILLVITIVSADDTQQTLGTFQKDQCINLKQSCANCSFVNITEITWPNGTNALSQVPLTKAGTVYNYSFCSTNPLGRYVVRWFADPDGSYEVGAYDLWVTESGANFDISQVVAILGLIAAISLFAVMGFSYPTTKWKLRMFFFTCSIIFTVILLNVMRLIIGTSDSLSLMGQYSLIAGIIILILMLSLFLIYVTIETMQYFKQKRKMRWTVSGG